ncbi:MAG: DUF1156 domain-containing protein [bacterium]
MYGWATRPLASCRAVIMGALLPDPVDSNCSENFRPVRLEIIKGNGIRSMCES